MLTTTAPCAWRAISPVSRVTWCAPYVKVFLTRDMMVSIRSGSPGERPCCFQEGIGAGAPDRCWSSRHPSGIQRAPGKSLAQAKLLEYLMILFVVFSLEVIEHLAALAHELQQPPPRMMILDVRLEMIGQPVDAGREQCDLDFRGTRVACGALVLLHDLRLLRNGNRHALL